MTDRRERIGKFILKVMCWLGWHDWPVGGPRICGQCGKDESE